PVAGSISYAGGVALVTNGATTTSIVVTGYDATVTDVNAFELAVARLNGTDGSLDTSFGGTGVVAAAPNSFGLTASVAIQNDGKIVVGGTYYTTGAQRFVVLRFDTDGTLDNTFDTTGMTVIPFNNFCQLESIALQADGKIVALGSTYNGSPAYAGFAIARLST